MVKLVPFSGPISDVLPFPPNEVPDVVDDLTIRITDLTPWGMKRTFEPKDYEVTSGKRTPLDIKYEWNTKFTEGKYIRLTIILEENSSYDADFIVDGKSESINQLSFTCGNSTAQKMFYNLSPSKNSITVHMKRIPLSPGDYAVFGLGIKFSNPKDPDQSMNIIYDPTVPNDGSRV